MAKIAKIPQSPGTVLKLFMRGFDLNPTRLAREIKLSQATVRLLTLDKTKVSVSAAFRLGKFFKINPEYWLTLQNKYDLAVAENDAKLVKVLKTISPAEKPSTKAAEDKTAAAGRKAAAGKGRKAKAGAKRGPKKAARKTAAKAASKKMPGKRGRKPGAVKK